MRIWLIVIVLVGFGVRLVHLGEQSLWYDEGVTWMLSQMRSPVDLIAWTAADIQPPLYYLLIWATDIAFGSSEWALRFPSVVFGVATIPLSYHLAQRLFPGLRYANIITAGLVALSPLLVYYSQEARMYTLLVCEAVLASYILLRVLDTPTRQQMLSYSLVAAAMLYTHYFAAFLLLAHALYTAMMLWRTHGQHLRAVLVMFGGAGLLFLPWVPVVLSRWQDDPSYWPGALNLSDALRDVLISFTVGETVFEAVGWWLALGYLLVLVGGGLCAIRKLPLNSVIFVGLWLVLPLTLILLLSYQSPKFNPRYLMLAWPAFALLLAAILAHLAKTRLVILPLLFIGATFGYSLFNWFTDPRFAKDDFQALAQFVRERLAPDETVLLSSGHMFPVWMYYFGGQNWTPLPAMQRLDVTRVTDLSIADAIAEAVEGHGGVWLVTWQDEVIDPNGVVPFWLDYIGERPNDAGDFWGVGLEHWRLTEADRLTENPIARPMTLNIADRVTLLGMTQLSDAALVLFWQARQPLPEEIIFALKLTDADGFTWHSGALVETLGSDFYPPSRWPMDEVIITRHRLPWQLGTPPGLYQADVELGHLTPTGNFQGWDILDEQGRPARRTALLERVNLSQLVQPDAGPPAPRLDPLVDFSPIVMVRRAILPASEAEPGDRILLVLLWQAGEFNTDDISVLFELVDTAGERFVVGQSLTPSRNYNLPRWKSGAVVLGQYWLDMPLDAAPGSGQVYLRVQHSGAFPYDERFPIAALEVLPTTRNFTPPEAVGMPVNVTFGDTVTLLGANCSSTCAASPGEAVTLTLYWRAESTLDTAYTVFTHALDATETVVINADHAPPKPTHGWVPGEIIADTITLTIPPDLPAGPYPLEVGLYNANNPTYPRLPLDDGTTRVILPGPLEVRP